MILEVSELLAVFYCLYLFLVSLLQKISLLLFLLLLLLLSLCRSNTLLHSTLFFTKIVSPMFLWSDSCH